MVSSACALVTAMTPAQPTQGGSEALYTQAAQTVVAQLTQLATALPTETPPSQTTEATPTATATLAPSDTPTSTATHTPLPPTTTPLPPTATPTPLPCDWAGFVEDVTVKDGTVFTPGSVFTKVWRLKNRGTCTWTGEYDLVFLEGERMDGPRAQALPGVVRPGETVDVAVELVAPDEEGRHRGYWLLRDSAGREYGIGEGGEEAFWVEIKVVRTDKYAYDFGGNYCAARWRSDAGRLACPGAVGDEEGFVVLIDRPVIEVGRLENEAALWTQPEDRRDGWIRGEYPEYDVEEGQHFKAVVGCLDNAPSCDVIFQLNYRVGGGDLQTLWERREVYDDQFNKVDVDLSVLAGQRVQFVLTVLANGSPKDDKAFWLVPRIVDVD